MIILDCDLRTSGMNLVYLFDPYEVDYFLNFRR